MKRFAGWIAITVFAVFGMGADPAHSDTFKFTICNNTTDVVVAATAGRVEPGSNLFEVGGWFVVGPGSCRFIGNFTKRRFYWYAEVNGDPNQHWSGDFAWCVRYPGPFTITTTGGSTCSENEFKMFNSIDEQKNSLTVSLGD
jgi:uncharacterized membrane protein